MLAKKIKSGIYWIGAIDWQLRDFHGYQTPLGSSYNAYLIVDKKVILIDTVKHHLFPEMLARLRSVIDPMSIDYVVTQHAEMDHAGSLPQLLSLATRAKVITSPAGKKALVAHFGQDWSAQVVQSGETLLLGEHTLKFIWTPMVHWPESMVSYCAEEKILFSQDAFGQHMACSERFDFELPADLSFREAQKYYANIVMPYGLQVQSALTALAGMPLEMIAPSHGIIWSVQIPRIRDAYQKWSSHHTDTKAVIIYDSMWGSTEKIAYALASAFEAKHLPCILYDLKHNHISDIMTEVLVSRYVLVGSPTLNNHMLPTVAAFLTYLQGLAPRNRIGLAFGSYGWGGQSIQQIEASLKACDFKLLPASKIQYVPSEKQLQDITATVSKSLENN